MMRYNPERNLVMNTYASTEYSNVSQTGTAGFLQKIVFPETQGDEIATFAFTLNTSSGKQIRPRFDQYSDAEGINRVRFSRSDSTIAENEETRLYVSDTLLAGVKSVRLYLDSNLTQTTMPNETYEAVKEVCFYIGSSSTDFKLPPEKNSSADIFSTDTITI